MSRMVGWVLGLTMGLPALASTYWIEYNAASSPLKKSS
jgi:hypothetical protein